MTTLNDGDAIDVALKYLKSKGIETTRIRSVRRIQGEIRKAYLPEKASDYWIITFERSLKLFDASDALDEETLEIMNAFSAQSDLVSVAVEIDGSAEVI